jgi:branched-subunit amino acid transport protein AzlD
MVVTFVTSIPAYFILYAPVRDNPSSITGAGPDPTASVALGAVLELILIIANVGTAVVPYAVFKRYSETLALGYLAARLTEAMFIAIGIISLLAFLFMRQEGTVGADAALGAAVVAIYDRAFLIGPGFFAGVANGIILGYLMYRSGLVPRGMAVLGLIGGPLVAASGIAVMFDVIERGSALQGVATIPEFIWELSFGIYLIVKGFKSSPTFPGAESEPIARGEGS